MKLHSEYAPKISKFICLYTASKTDTTFAVSVLYYLQFQNTQELYTIICMNLYISMPIESLSDMWYYKVGLILRFLSAA